MSGDPAGVDEQKAIAEAQAAPASRAEREKQQAAADFSRGSGKARMSVHVHSPFRDYFAGPAFALSAENATGPFDILPHHHNFISLLVPCEVVIRTVDGGEQRFRISGGILQVRSDRVIVFLDV